VIFNGVEIKGKLMGHRTKLREVPMSFFIDGAHCGDVNINAHTMPNVIAAVIRRSVSHKNEVTGCLERLKKPRINVFNEEHFSKFLDLVVNNMQHMCAMDGVHLPLSEQEYVDVAPAHKRKVYKTERVGLEKQVDLRKRDTNVRAHIKAEKKQFKKDLIPRLFYPRSTKYHIRLGRFIKPIEHYIYKAIDKVFNELFGTNRQTVTKGLNSPERGKLIAEAFGEIHDAVVLQFDCSHFDKHISKQMLKYEHKLYKKMYRGADLKELTKLLNMQLHNTMDVFTNDNYRVNWSVEGGRASGDVNTACGNVFLMCACVYSYYMDYVKVPMRFVDEGDDCFVIIGKKNADLFNEMPQVYETFGLTLRLEGRVHLLNKIKFCQTSPIFINNEWRMIRNLDAVFLKDTCCIQGSTLKQFKIWLHEVGMGGLALNSGVPVFQELYLKYIEWGNKGELCRVLNNDFVYSGLKTLSRNMETKVLEITEDSRFQFYLTTGLHPDAQRAAEREIRAMGKTLSFNGPVEKCTQCVLSYVIKTIETN
jgi:hypothetical protein